MPPTVEQLSSKDAELLRAFLLRDPHQNLYLLGLLEDFGIEPKPNAAPFAFWGAFAGRELQAVLFVGGNGGLVVPCANAPKEVGLLAEHVAKAVKARSALGAKASVDALTRILFSPKPKQVWTQKLYSVSADDLGPFTNPTLRLADTGDFVRVYPLALGWVREVLRRNPAVDDPNGFQARVMARIRAKRTYVLEVGSKIVFKVDVGSRSPHGAELEGLYTLPEERRRGHAVLSLGQISRHLLSSLPRLNLRIDAKDPSLAGVARRVGFVSGAEQRLVIAE